MSRRVRILGGMAFLSGIAFLNATVPGCGWRAEIAKLTAESKEWREQSEKWQVKSEKLEKEIGKFSENMEKAAGAIDPLAIKELLKKNETLAEKNAELERILANPPTGYLQLSGSDLRLDILRFKGKMFVECTIDSPDNLVLRESLRATEPTLTVGYTLAKTQADQLLNGKLDYINMKVVQFGLGNALGTVINILKNEIFPGIETAAKKADELYKDAFTNYLKTGAYETPTAERSRFFLESRFKTSGKHALLFTIKPEPDSPDWELAVELYQLDRTSGKEKLLIRSQYSRINDPNPTKLPPIYLDVKYSESKSTN